MGANLSVQVVVYQSVQAAVNQSVPEEANLLVQVVVYQSVQAAVNQLAQVVADHWITREALIPTQ